PTAPALDPPTPRPWLPRLHRPASAIASPCSPPISLLSCRWASDVEPEFLSARLLPGDATDRGASPGQLSRRRVAPARGLGLLRELVDLLQVRAEHGDRQSGGLERRFHHGRRRRTERRLKTMVMRNNRLQIWILRAEQLDHLDYVRRIAVRVESEDGDVGLV